jgi:CheY-like chemotaxis protein
VPPKRRSEFSDVGLKCAKDFPPVSLLMSLEKEKILLVDDERDFLDTYARILSRLGFVSLTAQDAPSAIELMERQRPGLVVTDLSLPIGDGFQVARRARAQVPPIPVIIVTAYHTAQIARKAHEEGASGYLAKPFTNHDLIEAIRRAVSRPAA